MFLRSQIKISKDFFKVKNKPQNNNWIIECGIHKVKCSGLWPKVLLVN